MHSYKIIYEARGKSLFEAECSLISFQFLRLEWPIMGRTLYLLGVFIARA